MAHEIIDLQARADAHKVRENRVRRMAARQGLRLEKTRRRDPNAVDFGKYLLFHGESRGILTSSFGVTLDEIEEYLADDELTARAYSMGVRVVVMVGSGMLAGSTLYQPVDIDTGKPLLGDDPMTNVFGSREDLTAWLNDPNRPWRGRDIAAYAADRPSE